MISSTPTYEKPHAIDGPIYEKPHAYDETPPVVTASRHSSRSSRTTVDSFASRYFKRKASLRSTTSTTDMCVSTPTSSLYQETYSPNTPSDSPPLTPQGKNSRQGYTSQLDVQKITSFLLSQSSPTTQGIFGHEAHIHSIRHAPSYASFKLPTNDIMDNSISAPLVHKDGSCGVNGTNVNNSTTQSPTHHLISHDNNSHIIHYDIENTSASKPYHYSLYYNHEDTEQRTLVYRKIQPHSYYGSINMLYKNLGLHDNSGEGVKVAEARRNLFQRDILIETADYIGSQCNMAKHIQEKKTQIKNIHSHELVKRSHSMLFEYETIFHGTLIRWKRPSLLSHDFTCEIKLTQIKHTHFHRKSKNRKHVDGFIESDSEDDGDDHDNHSHKTCRRWKLIAEYDNDPVQLQLGKLSIDYNVLNQIEMKHRNALESNLVITCCMLIDSLRHSLGKPSLHI